MNMLDNLSYEKLLELGKFVSEYDDIDSLKNDILKKIVSVEEEKSKSLNIRFNMDMFIKLQIFDPWELKVVRKNNINNLQELIDCDLDSLIGITPSIKEGLDWVRKFYNMEKHK